jgi:Cof subfamily protein (haloacid dehalogenase superfamily)
LIKLVGIDLDGTLLGPDQKISRKNIEAIKECQKRNIQIAIITGRTIGAVGIIIRQLGLKGFHIASSGAVLIDDSLKIDFALKIPGTLVKKAIQISRKWDRGFIIHTTDSFISYEHYHPSMDFIGESKKLFKKVDDFMDEEITENVLQLTALIDKDDEFNKYLESGIGESLKIRRAGPYFLNILNKNAGKVFGLKKLLKKTGINKDELRVIGDSEVDLGIIKYAGTGIAMGNSVKTVKDIADHIVSANDRDGVAEALDRFILNR